MKVFISLRKELLELARTSRLLVLAAVLLAFGLMSPLIAKFTPEMFRLIPGAEAFAGLIPPPTVVDAITQYIKNTSQFGILLALLLGMGMVAQEKEKGTAAMMLVKPLGRGSFVFGKFIALGLAFLGAMLLGGLGAYYYTAILFSAPDFGAWLALTLFMWVEILVYISITLLFSTLVRSQAAAAGLGLATILVFSLLGGLPGDLGQYLPGRLVAWGSSLLMDQPAPAWGALWVSLAIIAASLLCAWLALERQEL